MSSETGANNSTEYPDLDTVCSEVGMSYNAIAAAESLKGQHWETGISEARINETMARAFEIIEYHVINTHASLP